MASASDIVARDFTIDDTNDEIYAAIDALRSEKDRLAGKPMQLKMIDNQVQLAEQNLRRLSTSYENKIKLLNRILDEKKVRGEFSINQAFLEKGLEEVQTDVANLKVETSFLAGQINLLKKESEERKKEFDDQIADIRTKAADQNSWTEEIYSQVYTLQANSQLLMAEYEEKQKNLREKE
ncbi:hypothetical protein HK100_011442 [Physocladia obscura]|uniref:Uncharacterized protein n=1 Tax=Physocladia obscura TaxID=109957 RepID=A0AAD5T1V4_9FUNG|nr:hypothetical protein HK100_011442 [Physocladia obscura]